MACAWLASNECQCLAAGWRLSSPAHLASRRRAHQQACRNVQHPSVPNTPCEVICCSLTHPPVVLSPKPSTIPLLQACRNVKFSPAPLDLLAFAEHRSRCHLVDCRMWDRQQVGPAVLTCLLPHCRWC